MKNKLSNVQINLDRTSCEVLWLDGHLSRFHSKWLRFNCNCKRCNPTLTGVYLLDVTEFPEKILIQSAHFTDAELKVFYEKEPFSDHVTVLPLDWLRQKCYCNGCLQKKLSDCDVISRKNKTKSLEIQRAIPTISYRDLEANKDEWTFKCMDHIIQNGFCLLQDVPTDGSMCAEIAEMIGKYVDASVYGETFEVFARGEENAAYTELKLPLHQDQPQYEAAPGIQFLHALKFDPCITGGQSILVDLFEAVELLRHEFPDDFQTLTEVPGTFKTIDYNPKNPMFFICQKLHIVLDYFDKVVAVNWHPALAGSLQVHEDDVERYYKAYTNMQKTLQRSELQYSFRLQPGDLIAFNNRRMLHSRTAYQSNGGMRHLKGTYAKLDEMKCKYMILAKKLGKKVASPKLGNNSSI